MSQFGFRIIATRPGVGFAKLSATVALGVEQEDGSFDEAIVIPDWELRDTRAGELYVQEPGRVAVKKASDGRYDAEKDENQKVKYVKVVRLATSKQGENYRMTKLAASLKKAIETELIKRFNGASAENAGRGAPIAAAAAAAAGSKMTQAQALAGTATRQTATEGAERGLPFGDTGDLPF